MHAHACICMCVWRSEADVRYHSASFLTEPATRLAGYLAFKGLPLTSSQGWDYRHTEPHLTFSMFWVTKLWSPCLCGRHFMNRAPSWPGVFVLLSLSRVPWSDCFYSLFSQSHTERHLVIAFWISQTFFYKQSCTGICEHKISFLWDDCQDVIASLYGSCVLNFFLMYLLY